MHCSSAAHQRVITGPAQMEILSDQLPGFSLYFNIGVVAHRSVLHGPEIGTPDSLANWNIYEWTMAP
jgi:hypothetical protein